MGVSNELIMGDDWQAGLFGCFDDIGVCCYGYCCGPCLYGDTNEILEKGSCMKAGALACCCGLCTVCCYAPGRRADLRGKLGLAEQPCGDCIVWVCCPSCANCQEWNELKKRSITNVDELTNSAQAVATAQQGNSAA